MKYMPYGKEKQCKQCGDYMLEEVYKNQKIQDGRCCQCQSGKRIHPDTFHIIKEEYEKTSCPTTTAKCVRC